MKKIKTLLVNNEIKNSIDEVSIPFNIIVNNLFNTSIKRKYIDELDNTNNFGNNYIEDKNHIQYT